MGKPGGTGGSTYHFCGTCEEVEKVWDFWWEGVEGVCKSGEVVQRGLLYFCVMGVTLSPPARNNWKPKDSQLTRFRRGLIQNKV
jgi:hypothetical protein